MQVTTDELWTFLGLLFLTGLIEKGRLSDYWSNDPLLETPYFSKHTSRNRFQLILRFMHVRDNSHPSPQDKLWKVRTVYELLSGKFTTNYQPPEHLSLDEGVLAWRGRLSFKTYNPNKPDKYGVKGYIVADGVSGYVWRYQVYHGDGRKLIEIVEGLLEPARGLGHSVYMDNYYNSVNLGPMPKIEGARYRFGGYVEGE